MPKVWLCKKSGLKIYRLQGDSYQLQSSSQYLPTVDLPELIACVMLWAAAEQGTGLALRQLRQPWARALDEH